MKSKWRSQVKIGLETLKRLLQFFSKMTDDGFDVFFNEPNPSLKHAIDV